MAQEPIHINERSAVDLRQTLQRLRQRATTDSSIYADTGEPTGFVSSSAGTLSFDNATRTFTITGSHEVYDKGTKYTKGTNSVIIANTNGQHFIYYAHGTMVLTEATSFPGWGVAFVASVYWNGSVGLVGDERHGCVMDAATHLYLHTTVGTRFGAGLGGSFTDTTFSIGSGTIHDEDITITIGAQTTCRVLYRAAGIWAYTSAQAKYYLDGGGGGGANLQYDNAGALADVPANQYVAAWLFATNDIATPIYALVGQRVDTTLQNARDNNKYESLTLTNMPFKEMKLLYRVILRNDVTPYEEAQDLRTVSNLPGGTYVATDHGSLTGLADPDHPASAIYTNTTSFANRLTTSETTVQSALDKLDDHVTTVALGGTNSSTALNNGRLMISASGGIVESAHLFPDETNDGLGIGVASDANDILKITKTQNDASRVKLTNANNGASAACSFSLVNDDSALLDFRLVGSGNAVPNFGRIYLSADAPLVFYTNGTERARINGAGEVGIGKTADSGVDLDVNGEIRAVGSNHGALVVPQAPDTNVDTGVRFTYNGQTWKLIVALEAGAAAGEYNASFAYVVRA